MDEFIVGFVADVIEEAAIAAAADPPPPRPWEQPMDQWSISVNAFIKKFRLTKNLALDLVSMLEPLLHQKEIDVKTKVLCALNFFATGSYQTPVGDNRVIHLSQASTSRCIQEVVEALNNPLIFNQWVRFPENFQEMNKIVSGFYSKFGFPGVIGCIDCTHVAIVPPCQTDHDERSYVNRKNFHSINTQLICDANLKIINVNSKFPGSTHDAHIWNSSNVLTVLMDIHNRGHTNYHLIGDSGYALRPWCLTPLAAPEVGTPEYNYNESLVKARSTIERCNGVLKSRFRCLLKDRVLHYQPNKASKIINACVVLHNMCIQYGLEDPEMIEDENQLGMMPQVENHPANAAGRRSNFMLQCARQKQGNIVRNYFAV